MTEKRRISVGSCGHSSRQTNGINELAFPFCRMCFSSQLKTSCNISGFVVRANCSTAVRANSELKTHT